MLNSNDDVAGNDRAEKAKKIILREVDAVNANSSRVKQNGCAACHVLFTLANEMMISESDASDILSQILFHDAQLNDSFIEMVENIHMKQRMMGEVFAMKSRDAKDRYIDSNLKNLLEELSSDLVNYGHDILLRKLLISAMALQIAQNIGIDYHAATEELYYYMRKNDHHTHKLLLEFNDRFYKNIRR
jgi:hypothetical protein